MDLYLKQFLKEIANGKFKVTIKSANYKLSDLIKEDERYTNLYNWFLEKYKNEGRGIKSLIKDFNLPISYSFLRNLILFFKFELHSSTEANDFLCMRRSQIAKEQLKNKTGMYSEHIQNKIKNSITRGIQGYYWNSSKNKYVWLRSSWEFIYAKWLNSKNIEWDIEVKKYRLENNKTYLPDFFIYENNEIKTIVEIKGYWKDKLYKYNELKKHLNKDLILITDITPYLEKKLKEEIKTWKKLRKLELEG